MSRPIAHSTIASIRLGNTSSSPDSRSSARVDRPRHTAARQQGLDRFEVPERTLAQETEQFGSFPDHGLHGGILGIENSQRIGVQPALGIGVQQVGMAFEVGDQRQPVLLALGRNTQAVEFHPDTGQPDPL